MAADIKIGMQVSSSGTIEKEAKSAEKLHGALKGAADAATHTSKALQQAGGISGGELEKYNKIRGSVGTGAAGRDFANQAQGLGGVVRLYATFAANIFAVSAAFQNLQQAANFEKLIQSSKLMSERIGTDMMGLGKSIKEASNFALSLEESLQFANIGKSAGIATTQLVSLTEIAAGAAAALGRDVNDSIRRIIQGTAKQEQEILDELGIFIKSKKAYEDYARKFDIEGGAEALSAQQRVAAYADAVEKAGEKWKAFSKLDDPFARLTASGKEAIQNLLTIVNSVLKPILSFLAESQGAIAGILALISASLTKRALPEIKNLFLDLFTYDKVRAKAAAEAQRVEIAREMAQTANMIQIQQAKLAAETSRQPVTSSILGSAFGEMLSPGGRNAPAGINTAPLIRSIFGKDLTKDLSQYKQVEDIQKRIVVAINEQVRGNEANITKLKTAGVITQDSAVGQIKLSQQTITASEKIYQAINLQNTSLEKQKVLRTELNALSNQYVTQQERFGKTQPGQIQAIASMFPKAPARPEAGGVPAVGTTGMALSAGLGAWMGKQVGGFAAGRAAAAESSARLADVVGAGALVQLKSFGTVISDNLKLLMQMPTAARMAGIAITTLGTVIGGALRVAGAALGPLMLLYTVWEMFGPKLLDALGLNYTANKELEKKYEELSKTMENSGSAFSRTTSLMMDAILTNEGLGDAINTTISALQAQSDAIENLTKQKREYNQTKLVEEEKRKAKEGGYTFSPEAFAVEQLMTSGLVTDKERLDQLKEIRQQYREIANTQMSEQEANKQILEVSTRYSILQKEITKEYQQQASINAKSAAASKNIEDITTEISRKVKNMPKLGSFATTEEATKFAKSMETLLDPKKTSAQLAIDLKKITEQVENLAKSDVEGAAEALSILQQYQFGKIDTTAIQNIMKESESFKKLLIGISNATNVYTSDARTRFTQLENSIKSAENTLISLDTAMQSMAAINKRNEEVRGYSTGLEISAKKQVELTKANQEYAKTLAQIALEEEKVTKKAGAGEEAQKATQKADLERTRAKLLLDQRRQVIEINAKEESINSKVKEITKEYEKQVERNKALIDVRTAYFKYDDLSLQISKQTNNLSEKDLALREQSVELAKIDNKYATDRTNLLEEQKKEIDIIKARKASSEEEQKALKDIEDKYNLRINSLGTIYSIDKNIVDLNTQQKLTQAELAETLKEINNINESKELAYSTEVQLLSIQKDLIQQQLDQGILTQDQYSTQLRALERNTREMEYQEKLRKLMVERERALQTIYAAQIDGELTPELSKRLGETIDKYKQQEDALKRVKTAQDDFAAGQENLNSRQKAFGEVFKQTFDGMADAIVELTKTGKMNFRGLVNSMLQDLLRLELKMQSEALYKFFRPSLMNLFSSGPTQMPGYEFSHSWGMGPGRALGAAYDRGIEYYAKGGAFTNKIVNSPTMFKFARGTGLMGEAGPEAIMPLKRDSQGNLGVRGGGSNVDIVVNNYSGQPAQARETTDSRGNRRVEVTVGEMTAGEITRGGSSANRSIRSTFGLQPQLIRR